MAEKPTFYQRTEKLLRSNFNASLSDFNIQTDSQLRTQWPPKSYTPAEIADHYAHKHNLTPLWG